MSPLRSSLLGAAAIAAILLAAPPSNAAPGSAAPANSLGLAGREVIVQIQSGPAAGGPAIGGPRVSGPGPGAGPRVSGPGPSGGPRFNTGPRFGSRQFSGPSVTGRQFARPQFQGYRFAFRRGRFHGSRFNGGPAYWPYVAAAPLYGYGYSYCERVLEPRLTRRGIVMRWVRRCPGEDYYPYW